MISVYRSSETLGEKRKLRAARGSGITATTAEAVTLSNSTVANPKRVSGHQVIGKVCSNDMAPRPSINDRAAQLLQIML